MKRIHIGPLDFYGCHEARERLFLFLDRELPRAEERRVAFHLRICRECAPLFAFEAKLNERVQFELASAPMPEDVRAKLASVVGNEQK